MAKQTPSTLSRPYIATSNGERVPATLPSSMPPASPKGRVVYGDLNIRIDRDGVWYYEGSRIDRKELVCLFASLLVRDSVGEHWLVTSTEIGHVEVEDAPFVAVELFTAGSARERVISFRTNVDEIVTVDDDHPLRVVTQPETGEPSPYVTLRMGLEARIVRPVYYELVDLGMEDSIESSPAYGVWSKGSFFSLGCLDDDT